MADDKSKDAAAEPQEKSRLRRGLEQAFDVAWELGAEATHDIRHKVVEEPWFGRAVTEAQETNIWSTLPAKPDADAASVRKPKQPKAEADRSPNSVPDGAPDLEPEL
ncbi:hypothetical protein [Jiella sonneratiae]|uniref:DUF2934 domain-containing protein n=1 Tax=Jiella sonneratiae TaxID=2816856 RepID=A0ABS3JAT7_9HYPH|nr:hypothetical protein [Jiella sonneratiae]MBO0906277.1 hypothetical protein [Jiella sonneratiae]